jgi:hypothetical protein
VTGVTSPICCPCCLATQGSQVATFCCPPTAICARPLTISSAPNPSSYGAAVTITGTITTSGQPSVTLWQELPGEKAYQQIAVTNAGADDSYTFKIKAGTVTTDRNWYVANGSEQSSIDDQAVRAAVGASDVVTGGDVVLSGQVRPSHAGQQVLVERRAGAQWDVVGKARLSARSRYRLRVSLAGAGRAALRVQLPADARNTDSFSKPLTVTAR